MYKLSGLDFAAAVQPGRAEVRPTKRARDAGAAGSSASHALDVGQSSDSDCVYLGRAIGVD